MDALAWLYDRYAKDVHRFVFCLSGDQALAEDITSEVFLKVWDAPEPPRMGTARAYLFTIARNLFLNELRRRSRRTSLDVRLADGTPGPEPTTERNVKLAEVLDALQQLPELDRSALLMRALHELSYVEIGAALAPFAGCSSRQSASRATQAGASHRFDGVTPMNVTRDVILDLLPLYLAGDASDDTRTLVDEFLQSDPTLARFARRQSPDTPLAAVEATLPANHGAVTLHKARTLLWLRTLFLGFAVLFSLIPFTVISSPFTLRIYPPAMSIWLAALACWIGFVIVIRRLRLPPRP